ncbi:MAG TPA: DUF4446 family protein [Abditibacterium sp.]|jgi:hypothetical protein
MQFFQPYLAPMCVGALALIVAQFIWVALLSKRLERQSKMVRQFFQGPNDEDMEGLLRRSMEVAEVSAQRCETAMSEIEGLRHQFGACVQRFALVRYDAFEDVTGQQSFSLVFLDGNHNGAAISSIFGRSSSRTFGKMIVNGQPEQNLTDEEQEALLQALGRPAEPSKPERPKAERQRAERPRERQKVAV